MGTGAAASAKTTVTDSVLPDILHPHKKQIQMKVVPRSILYTLLKINIPAKILSLPSIITNNSERKIETKITIL